MVALRGKSTAVVEECGGGGGGARQAALFLWLSRHRRQGAGELATEAERGSAGGGGVPLDTTRGRLGGGKMAAQMRPRCGVEDSDASGADGLSVAEGPLDVGMSLNGDELTARRRRTFDGK